jgi:hypothetical protein
MQWTPRLKAGVVYPPERGARRDELFLCNVLSCGPRGTAFTSLNFSLAEAPMPRKAGFGKKIISGFKTEDFKALSAEEINNIAAKIYGAPFSKRLGLRLQMACAAYQMRPRALRASEVSKIIRLWERRSKVFQNQIWASVEKQRASESRTYLGIVKRYLGAKTLLKVSANPLWALSHIVQAARALSSWSVIAIAKADHLRQKEAWALWVALIAACLREDSEQTVWDVRSPTRPKLDKRFLDLVSELQTLFTPQLRLRTSRQTLRMGVREALWVGGDIDRLALQALLVLRQGVGVQPTEKRYGRDLRSVAVSWRRRFRRAQRKPRKTL